MPQDDSLSSKLDHVFDRLDKIDMWKDETDRRVDYLEPVVSRDAEPPSGFDDGDDWGDAGVWRTNYGDRGYTSRYPGGGFRDSMQAGRGRRGGRGRPGSCWDPPGMPQTRTRAVGFDQPQDRPATCWDPPQRFNPNISGYDQPKLVHMDAPRFDGSDATNWISRVQYYFNHLMMPEAQRLHYAVMLFDPPASEWVFNYTANNDFVTWQDFLEDVRHRFDRESFKNYYGLIAKLTQTGSVTEYHDTFERYLNRVQGVSESDLFTLFVAGLKQEMQERLRLHQPSSLAAAMALSLELASTLPDSRAQGHSPATQPRRQWPNRDSRGAGGTVQQSQGAAASQNTPGQPRVVPVRVSQAEKSERSRLGLCWHCPEKWVMGHVCKHRLLCYADEEDVLGEPEQDTNEATEPKALDIVHIHSMKEGRRSRPLRVVGMLQGREVSILIDTGSDRDLLHPRVAQTLHLATVPN